MHQSNTLTWCDGDILNLHLSTDSNAKISTHTNELFARIGIMLFVWVLASAPWLMNIDDILAMFVDALDPCGENCLNLYQPEKWSELRWIVSGLLGFLSIIPLVNLQIWNFAKPGLTSTEKKMLRNVLVLLPILFLFFSYVSLFMILPEIYQIGHNIHVDYGFAVKYDAISLIHFASVILWVQVLIITASSIMISSGVTGNLDSENANWWRLRIYGFIAMVSMLSYYETTSNGLLITLVTLAIIETISRPWTTKSSKYSFKLETSYDHLGEIISTLKVSCNCVKGGLIIADSSALSLENLCNDKLVQDELIGIIIRYNPNKLTIINCSKPEIYHSLNQVFPNIEIEFKG